MNLRRFILTFCIALSFGDNSFCQNKQIDSLKLVLAASKEDTNKVNTLNLLCSYLLYKYDAKDALQYGNEALSLSKKIDFNKGKGSAYFYIGNAFTQQDNYSAGLKNLYSALNFFEETGDKKNTAKALQKIGSTYVLDGNYSEASKNILASIKASEEVGDKSGVAQSNNSLSEIYFNEGRYAEANERILSALKLYQSLGNRAPDWGIPWCYEGIGSVYEKMGDSASVDGGKINSVNFFSEALKNYFISLKEWGNIDRKDAVAELDDSIGNVYMKLGKLSAAKDYLQKGLKLSLSLMDKEDLRAIYRSLSILKSTEGNYKQAYEHYKMYILYRDSMINEASTRQSLQSKIQYEFDKKKDSLNQKQLITETKLQSQKKQKYFYWVGLIMLALLSFFVFLNFRNQKKINRLAGETHAKQKAELELQSLRAQLNPHFMFNSLNAIQELILLEENEKSQSYLARFAKLLRMLLENAERPFIPLQREIDFLKLYLSLENLRIPDLQYSINVDPFIDPEQIKIPNMILQPYIENAIWHGLSHKQGDKRLQIRIERENGFTKYEIEDNGVGRKKSAELKSLFRKEHKSKGMELLSKRFKLLAKEYGSDIETTITDVMNNGEITGTAVTIKIPVGFSGEIKK